MLWENKQDQQTFGSTNEMEKQKRAKTMTQINKIRVKHGTNYNRHQRNSEPCKGVF